MKTVNGIYAEAKIFTDDVEDYALAQVKMICDNEIADGSTVCMMPDIHPGKPAPIGLSMTVTDKVIPQLLGVDIGCGMTCVKLNRSHAEFQKLDRVIRESVPSGFSIRKEPHHMAEDFSYEGLHCHRHINRQKADRSLGTLGGGNHFIELDKGDDGSLYLVVHTGSRHLGEEVAEYYTQLANICLKEKGREVPYYMSYLEGENKAAYLEDVQIIQRYADWNRQIIVREILKGMKCVRIIHVPTGLVSQSTEERSQFLNKQRAMEKLQEKLAALQKEQEAGQKNAAWREHTRIVRGNPVRTYEGAKFILKK